MNNKYNLTPGNYDQAITIQNSLRKKVCLQTRCKLEYPFCAAGCDSTIIKEMNLIISGIIVFKFESENEYEIVEKEFIQDVIKFPYIPGLLSFREIPSLLKGFKRIKTKITLIYADSQGYAHPRRLGLASHLGVILDIPVIGVAKSRFIGDYKEPGMKKGSYSKLTDGDEQIGIVYRNKSGVKSVFISPGNLIGMDDLVNFIQPVSGKFRIPVPTRIAHIETGVYRKEILNGK